MSTRRTPAMRCTAASMSRGMARSSRASTDGRRSRPSRPAALGHPPGGGHGRGERGDGVGLGARSAVGVTALGGSVVHPGRVLLQRRRVHPGHGVPPMTENPTAAADGARAGEAERAAPRRRRLGAVRRQAPRVRRTGRRRRRRRRRDGRAPARDAPPRRPPRSARARSPRCRTRRHRHVSVRPPRRPSPRRARRHPCLPLARISASRSARSRVRLATTTSATPARASVAAASEDMDPAPMTRARLPLAHASTGSRRGELLEAEGHERLPGPVDPGLGVRALADPQRLLEQVVEQPPGGVQLLRPAPGRP